VSGRAGGEEKGCAEVLSVGQANLQSIGHGRLRLFSYLGRFCDDREFTDEFAASAEVACDRNALELGPGLAERILGVCKKSGGTTQVEAASPLFAMAKVCRILVCNAAPSPLAFLTRSSLAAASSSRRARRCRDPCRDAALFRGGDLARQATRARPRVSPSGAFQDSDEYRTC
jgi:hypothetical protein